MQDRRLGDRLTVSGQVSADGIARLGDAGVALLINTRPDGEEPGQMSAEAAAALAADEGLAYRHVPVRMGAITRGDVDAFGAAMGSVAGPVHAHCKSGLRAALLWGLDRVLNHGASADAVARELHEAGFDPTGLLVFLERAGRT